MKAKKEKGGELRGPHVWENVCGHGREMWGNRETKQESPQHRKRERENKVTAGLRGGIKRGKDQPKTVNQ